MIVFYLVKRSHVFITLLLSLFMFQSLWNVAAAFCVHEESKSVSVMPHFGHHVTASCESKSHGMAKKSTTQPTSSFDLADFTQDDHSDHLPSFSPVMAAVQAHTLAPHQTSMQVLRHYDWHNLYQSPDLFTANPPPVFAPLLVG